MIISFCVSIQNFISLLNPKKPRVGGGINPSVRRSPAILGASFNVQISWFFCSNLPLGGTIFFCKCWKKTIKTFNPFCFLFLSSKTSLLEIYWSKKNISWPAAVPLSSYRRTMVNDYKKAHSLLKKQEAYIEGQKKWKVLQEKFEENPTSVMKF